MLEFITRPIRDMMKMPIRDGYSQLISLVLVIGSALMSWKTLVLLTGSETPIVVVLSGSMEPAFYRGDILFLSMGKAPIRSGEVVVYNTASSKDIPIVHRALRVHERTPVGQDPPKIEILTKGDANYRDDRMLYPRGVQWLEHHHLLGRVTAYMPYVGYITIVMNDHPWLKVVVLGGLGLVCLLTNED